ncbi:MAG: acyl carrier protein [Peptococcaceae bacterium BRH_c4b]|nr:MAG: acyl carrier protein [Peptococcaceae bacterium BRH_c4b]
MNLEDRIIAILKNNLQGAPEITLETRLVEDLMIDSLDKLMIISALEDEFSLAIDEEDFAGIVTVNDIAVKLRAEYL